MNVITLLIKDSKYEFTKNNAHAYIAVSLMFVAVNVVY